MIKKSLLTFQLLCIISALSFCAVNDGVTIAILKSRDIEPYNIAMQSTITALQEKGIKVNIIMYDMTTGEDIIQWLKSARPDVILSIGTESTKSIHGSVRDTPIVFSMVLDPAGNGFINPADNITGVAMDISPVEQFEALKSILPNVKRVGIVYNPENTGSIIEEAMTCMDKFGLQFITRQVNTNKEVPDVLEKLIGKVDILWAVPDSTVFSPMAYEHILLFSLRNKIPIMGFSPNFVRAGALFTLSCDYEDIGKQTGEIIAAILNGDKSYDIPVAFPRKTLLILNARCAEVMGIEIPEDVFKKADKIFRAE